MATDKQIAANRLNAQKSTGPRSAAGKTQSAQNARKHRFAASIFTVVRLEQIDEICDLRQDLADFYHPVNSQELWAVERIALCQLSLIRASRLEAGLFTTCLDQALGSDGQPIHPMSQEMAGLGKSEITIGQEHNFDIAESFHRLARTPHTWALFLRYQAQAERNYRRAVQEFERLRALRPQLEEEQIEETPNEPGSVPQPEANNSDPASETNPIPPDVGQAPPPARDPLVALPARTPSPLAGSNPIPTSKRRQPQLPLPPDVQ
jgi:hypothetical protein